MTHPETSAYLADVLDLDTPLDHLRTLTDPDVAADRIEKVLLDRVMSILDAFPGHIPTVMVGGGVDSASVALTLFQNGIEFETTTFFAEGHTSDLAAASALSLTLGVDHYPLMLRPGDTEGYVRRAVDLLGTAELWEVSAAIPFLMLRDAIDSWGPAPRVLLNGGGADSMFLGDKKLPYPIGGAEARRWIDEQLRAEVARSMTRNRLVPAFYERLLGDDLAARTFMVYRCQEVFDVAVTLDSPTLFRGPTPNGCEVGVAAATVDKYALRKLVARYEPLRWIASAAKMPLQRSSGIQQALFEAAAWEARSLPDAMTYRDPLSETPDAVAARLWMDRFRHD